MTRESTSNDTESSPSVGGDHVVGCCESDTIGLRDEASCSNVHLKILRLTVVAKIVIVVVVVIRVVLVRVKVMVEVALVGVAGCDSCRIL